MTDEEICRRMEWPKAFLVCGDDFAVRIRALVHAAEAAEREACASIVDVPPGSEALEIIGGQETMDLLSELAAKIRMG